MNIFKVEHAVSRKQRFALNNHKSAVLWLTGLPASGKSTIARELEKQLLNYGVRSFILDGDNIRSSLNKDLKFSRNERFENIRRIAEVSNLLMEAGLFAIVAAIAPFRDDREKIRQIFNEGEFIEVYVNCPLSECEKRDPKGLYKRARESEIKEFTGVSSPYEEPVNPEITIYSDKQSVIDSSTQIMGYLEERKLLQYQ